jgi:hypothetical protein
MLIDITWSILYAPWNVNKHSVCGDLKWTQFHMRTVWSGGLQGEQWLEGAWKDVMILHSPGPCLGWSYENYVKSKFDVPVQIRY